MPDLHVSAQHLGDLATTQDQASKDMDAAINATDGITKNVWLTHGCYVGVANTAIGKAEDARHAAGEALKASAAGLAETLRVARNRYQRTDTQGRQDIDKQVLDR